MEILDLTDEFKHLKLWTIWTKETLRELDPGRGGRIITRQNVVWGVSFRVVKYTVPEEVNDPVSRNINPVFRFISIDASIVPKQDDACPPQQLHMKLAKIQN